MALINCKETGCTSQVDTTLACTEVTSLFGLRVMLEHHLDNKGMTAFFPHDELKKQLSFVNGKLEQFGIKEQEEALATFKKSKLHGDAVQPRISTLYLECAKGHRHYYDVQCEF